MKKTVVGHALARPDTMDNCVARTFMSAASRFVSTFLGTARPPAKSDAPSLGMDGESRMRRDESRRGKHECLRHVVSAVLLAATAFAQIPTPESVLGHKPGDDFYLATYEDSINYFKKLAASSNRIKLVNVGKSTQGRDWFIAFISNPENLAQLEHYKEISRRLALARGVTDEQA